METEAHIEEIKNFSPDLVPTLNHLLKQLNSDAKELTQEDIRFIIDSEASRLFVAKKPNGEIVGMVTLIIYRIPFAKKGLLEDIVVHEIHRGQGIGAALVKFALVDAKKEGVSYVDFTSNPTRVAANKLYESLGFKKRDTNVYRIKI